MTPNDPMSGPWTLRQCSSVGLASKIVETFDPVRARGPEPGSRQDHNRTGLICRALPGGRAL